MLRFASGLVGGGGAAGGRCGRRRRQRLRREPVVRTFWTQHAEIAAALAPRPGTNELVVGEYENDKVVIYDWKTGILVAELGSHANGNWQDGRTRQAPMLLRLRPRIRS